jgi:radical SAM superfamily enzyme YgiQ (UPF0313 family)
MVFIGESELCLKKIMKRMDHGEPWKSISEPGIVKKGDPKEKYLPGPILEDLNDLPLPDFDLQDQFILYENNRIVQLDKSILARCTFSSYRLTCSRGCPYACTYCCNNALNRIYKRKLPVRQRPIEHVMQELEMAKRLMPGLREVDITDDAFLAQPQERIEEFAKEYHKRVNLPFKFLTTPITVTVPKMKILAEIGMCATAVGMQSGSLRTRTLYNRYDTIDNVLSVGEVINKVIEGNKRQIGVRYDVILDNPWETEKDLEDSLRVALRIKRPFDLALFSLTLYPGTDLYEKARKEGIIQDDLNQIYRRSQLAPNRTYLNALFFLLSLGMPNPWVEYLLEKPLPRKKMVRSLYSLIVFYTLKKKVKSVIFKGFLRGNFKWVKVSYMIFLETIKQKFTLAKNKKLVRFTKKAGEF